MRPAIVCALIAILVPLPNIAGNLRPSPAHIFQVPTFPGTVLFETYSGSMNHLMPPFATSLKVYRTSDGKPIEKEVVIGFYREHFQGRGWKEGIFKRRGDEPYLSMRTDVCESLPDGTRIQVSGEFYLWVAAKEGMLTAYMVQWRISSTDQSTLNSVQAIIARLQGAASEAGYETIKVESDTGWEKDYENEYLIDRRLFTLTMKGAKGLLDLDPSQYLRVAIRVYRDMEIAEVERKLLHNQIDHNVIQYGPVGRNGKVVITIVDYYYGNHKEVVNSILSALVSAH